MFPTPLGRMSSMFDEMQEEMDALLNLWSGVNPRETRPERALSNETAAFGFPAVDIKEDESQIVITADVPGLGPKDIKVTMSPDRVLAISGERKVEKEEGDESQGFRRVERAYGSFVRRFKLPENVVPGNIKAKTEHGVLQLTVPKAQAQKEEMHEIPIEGAGSA
jgi:HSP20 family protein